MVKFWGAMSWPNARGSESSAPMRTLATPIVATVRMRRGALAKRLMKTNSTTPPVTSAAAIPAVMHTQ